VLKHLRGKIATYNAHLRAIADRNDLAVTDIWPRSDVPFLFPLRP